MRRFINFLKVFKHSRRGIIGVAILVFFISVALLAPVLSPYDPIYQYYLAGDYSAPIWFRQLSIGKSLSSNLHIIQDLGFSTPQALDEWTFEASSTSASVSHSSEMGRTNPGSLTISFNRAAKKPYAGSVTVTVKKQFEYPFEGSPKRFRCPIYMWFTGIEDLQYAQMKISLGNASAPHYLWSQRFTNTSTGWQHPFYPLDSYNEDLKGVFGYGGMLGVLADPAKIIFTGTGTYVYIIEVTFMDTKVGTLGKNVEARVYLDDISVDLSGSAFGLLGTDQWGRDIFSQLVYGSQLSLFVGLLAAALSVLIGLSVGLICGYLGKIVDEALMRFSDMLLVIPMLPLLVVLIAVLGPSIWYLILLLGFLGWMGFARMVRSQVLSLKERPFVEAAKAVGAGKFHIILRHILPNVMSLVYVSLALAVPSAILSEAALSWLGLFDPRVMSWGRMLHDAQAYGGVDLWWWVIPPGLCIALVSLSFILLGYALDDILNPRLRQRR